MKSYFNSTIVCSWIMDGNNNSASKLFVPNQNNSSLENKRKSDSKLQSKEVKSTRRLSLPASFKEEREMRELRRSGRARKATSCFQIIEEKTSSKHEPKQTNSLKDCSGKRRRSIAFPIDDGNETCSGGETFSTCASSSSSEMSASVVSKRKGSSQSQSRKSEAKSLRMNADNNAPKVKPEPLPVPKQTHNSLKFVNWLFQPQLETKLNPIPLFATENDKLIIGAKRITVDGKVEYLMMLDLKR